MSTSSSSASTRTSSGVPSKKVWWSVKLMARPMPLALSSVAPVVPRSVVVVRPM